MEVIIVKKTIAMENMNTKTFTNDKAAFCKSVVNSSQTKYIHTI